jgi:hypothetical protein
MQDGYGPINIIEAGAKGDGVTDDTDAIQEAINRVCARGGGKLFFPFTPRGYRIARPAREEIDGHRCRGQLYIPFRANLRANIHFEGEMPCKLLYSYMVRRQNNPALPNTHFDRPNVNTFLFSDWEAPEEHDPEARPWSLLAALEGDIAKGRFGVANVSIRNIEFQSRLDPDKLYPTASAVNLQNASRVNISDSQFCLDRNIGDADLGRWLQPNPCHTAALIMSGDQNDDNVLHNVAAQGHRYGFVLGEHVVADYLYVHNSEQALIFHDSSHLSAINHIVAQHNQKIVNTTENNLFGMRPGPCHVEIAGIDFEAGGPDHVPEVSNMTHGVWDPGDRLFGRLGYHCGCPCGLDFFPKQGGANLICRRL